MTGSSADAGRGPARPAPLDVPLDVDRVAADPLVQFRQWWQAARDAGAAEPDAMVLSTVDAAGWPHGRAVILRAVDHGFVFLTHHQSAKGRHLDGNPRAALTLVWPVVQRQVRVEGVAVRLGADEVDRHHMARPREAQLAAWVSDQRSVLAGRHTLEQRLARLRAHGPGAPLARPPGWGGYRVVPRVVELWQGRGDRLHDRLRYRASPQGWHIERLAP